MILVIATKVPLRDVSPITIVWLGFAMGIVVLELAVALRKEFALLGFLGITFHQWLQSNGLKMSEAGTTAWIVATAPVFMALLGIFCSGLAYIAWYDALQALSPVGMGVFSLHRTADCDGGSTDRFGRVDYSRIPDGGGIILFGAWLVDKN